MNNLSDSLRRFARLSIEKKDQVKRASLLQLGNEMEIKSPVDKGTFKSAWVGAIGEPSNFVSSDSSRDSAGELSIMLQSLGDGDVFYYTNSMPYAKKLEDGHSSQAAGGMVRLTARRWKSIVSRQIRMVR